MFSSQLHWRFQERRWLILSPSKRAWNATERKGKKWPQGDKVTPNRPAFSSLLFFHCPDPWACNPAISLASITFLSSTIAFILFFLFFVFCLFRAAPTACGISQARGLIGPVAADLHLSHSNTGSEPCLRPTPIAHSNAGSLTH